MIVVYRYLRLMGDKTIPDSAEPRLESFCLAQPAVRDKRRVSEIDLSQPMHETAFWWRHNGPVTSQLTDPIKWPNYSLELTHWGRVTHTCVGNLTIIGSDNGLSPGRRQAITWTNVGILLIGPLRTNFSEMLIEIHTFPFKKIHLKMSSGKWWPFCLGLNVLIAIYVHMSTHNKESLTQRCRRSTNVQLCLMLMYIIHIVWVWMGNMRYLLRK